MLGGIVAGGGRAPGYGGAFVSGDRHAVASLSHLGHVTWTPVPLPGIALARLIIAEVDALGAYRTICSRNSAAGVKRQADCCSMRGDWFSRYRRRQQIGIAGERWKRGGRGRLILVNIAQRKLALARLSAGAGDVAGATAGFVAEPSLYRPGCDVGPARMTLVAIISASLAYDASRYVFCEECAPRQRRSSRACLCVCSEWRGLGILGFPPRGRLRRFNRGSVTLNPVRGIPRRAWNQSVEGHRVGPGFRRWQLGRGLCR